MNKNKIKKLIKAKKHPQFLGSFGKRGQRKGKKWLRWRRPRGRDNEKKMQKKADGQHPSTGHKTMRAIRFLHPSGLPEKMIYNEDSFNENDKNFVLRISGTVGNKKRIKIAEKAEKLGLKLLNKGNLFWKKKKEIKTKENLKTEIKKDGKKEIKENENKSDAKTEIKKEINENMKTKSDVK